MSDVYAKVSARIDNDWYPFHRGEWFSQEDIWKFFNWKEPETRKAVSRKLYNETKELKVPILEKLDRKYRLIDVDLEEMDWQSADEKCTIDLVFPFDLQKYVKIFPKGIVVISGTSNAGKTAFLYNFILDNMGKHIITLYNSETSKEQMKERMLNFHREIPAPAPFKTVERYDNFADVIHPDQISVIDYIDHDIEVYLNGAEITRIFRKLNKGVAVVALQKKPNPKDFKGREIRIDIGYGGTPTVKRASLYIAMDSNRLRIVKGKSWVNSEVNPSGLAWKFKLVEGAHFVNIEEDNGEE